MELSRRDFLALGAATAAAVGGIGLLGLYGRAPLNHAAWAGKTVGAVRRIPSMCQGCTTACGVIATVKDGRLISIFGNPEDPNSQGSVCAKGVAGPSMLYDPYRLLYPLRRVGARGQGQWKRITWEEAYTEMADRLRAIRERGHPEEFAWQQGRNRSSDIISRFLNAFGTPTTFTHRALCSLNRRAAMLSMVGDTDWDTGDYEHSDYILNFGCNWAEAHQGHIPTAIRIMRARERRGAKIVTFETRLSNSAAVSDEWFCVKPGTDGLIALAMGHVICQEGLWNKPWVDTWSNYPGDRIAVHLAQYTPEWAARESGVPAEIIVRIAREFAAAAPRCTTINNRGSHAHWNGFYNDRAILLLNALVGNIGAPGGLCWSPFSAWDTRRFPAPSPVPPRPTARSVITEAKDWPLANAWRGNEMRVGTIVYQWLKERRQQLSFLFTYNTDQAWAWPEMGLVQEVLRDEEIIPFHVVLDVAYSETAHLADLVLPWATWMERWDIDSRPPLGLVDYVGLRQPVVEPLGEAKDVRDIFPELARRIGGGMERYFPWQTTEEYLEAYFTPVPGGLAHMRQHGVWMDPQKAPNYRPYARALTATELDGSTTDPATGIVYKGEDPATKQPHAIGIMVQGVARRGFTTPSRKLEVDSQFVKDKGEAVSKTIEPLPVYDPIPDHQRPLDVDQLIMISFKWNVHNAHRTMQSKWLQEIVHTNPAWLNPATAGRLGLAEGDWVEVTSYRPRDSQVPHDDGSVVGTLKTRVHLTEGVHPQVIAISHNHGRWVGGPIASRQGMGAAEPFPGVAGAPTPDERQPWWSGELSVAQNNLMPIYPDPRSGQQAFHDTIVRVRKLPT
jgi:anaerobic selenocysteine-containing dehydrogenase